MINATHTPVGIAILSPASHVGPASGGPESRVGRPRAIKRAQTVERLVWGPAWSDSGLAFTHEDGNGSHPEGIGQAFRRRSLTRAARGTTMRPHPER